MFCARCNYFPILYWSVTNFGCVIPVTRKIMRITWPWPQECILYPYFLWRWSGVYIQPAVLNAVNQHGGDVSTFVYKRQNPCLGNYLVKNVKQDTVSRHPGFSVLCIDSWYDLSARSRLFAFAGRQRCKLLSFPWCHWSLFQCWSSGIQCNVCVTVLTGMGSYSGWSYWPVKRHRSDSLP